MAKEVGNGQVAIFAVFKGMRKSILAAVDGSTADAGKRFNKGFTSAATTAGTSAGRGFNKSFSLSTKDLGTASLASLQKAVAQTSTANSSARLREQDAIGRVNVAQASYNATIAKYAAGTPQYVRASESLASAQRRASLAGETAKNTWASLSTAQNNLKTATESTAQTVRRSQGSLSAFSKVGDSIGGSFSTGMNLAVSVVTKAVDVIVGIAVAGAAAAGVAIGAALTAGFSRLSTIETAQAKLKALGNTSVDISEIMANANTAVLGTQYSLADAVTGAAAAVAAGIKPGKDLTKYLKLQANAAALAGVGFSDLGLVMNQVQSQNKAYTQDLNQVASRGIPIYQGLQKVYGTTREGLRDMLQAGEVDAEHFRAALELNVGNASDEIGKTTIGSFENMKAAFSRFGAELLSPVYGGFKDVFVGVTSGLDRMKGIIQPLVDKYGPKLAEVFKPFTDEIGPKLSGLFDDIQKAADSPEGQKWFSDMGKNLKDIATALGDSLPSFVKFTGKALKLTATMVKLSSATVPPLIDGWKNAADFGSDAIDKLTNGAKQIRDWGVDLGTAGGNGLKQIGDYFSDLGMAFDNGKQQIQNYETDLVDAFSNGGRQLYDFAGSVGTFFADIGGKFGNGGAQIGSFFGDLGGRFTNGAQQLSNFGGSVGSFFTGIGGSFANGGRQIGGFFADLGGKFANGGQQIGSFANDVGTNIGRAASFIGELPGKAVAALGDLGTTLFSSGKALIDGFRKGIEKAAKDAVAAVSNLMKDVAGFFPHSPAKRGPFSGSGWTNLPKSGEALMVQWTSGFSNADYQMAANVGQAVAGVVPTTGRGAGGVGMSVTQNISVTTPEDPRVVGWMVGREAERALAGMAS